mgnify:CR=1 FL=1|tara:strand:- start:22635 stop:22919 length:285 start_codon:yes stop_codon:yes gene_type:complete
MSESVERDFEVYGHLGDLPDGKRERAKAFFNTLEDHGFFTRTYDPKSLELIEAARIIHRHLCTLDGSYYSDAVGTSIVDFANAYSSNEGLRVLD